MKLGFLHLRIRILDILRIHQIDISERSNLVADYEMNSQHILKIKRREFSGTFSAHHLAVTSDKNQANEITDRP